MNTELLSTAMTIGILHTAIGLDHYIPFVAMSKANNWTFAKTAAVVFVCGIAHVLSSVVLGLLGILLGAQLTSVLGIQHFRAEIALWFLIAFGFVYMLIGIAGAIKNKPHKHIAAHSFLPLFVLFILGPCELLIPLLMYPAAQNGMMSVAAVAVVYSVCTIATMIFCTAVVLKGVNIMPVKKIERYSHALAGFAVFICGLAVLFWHSHGH